ncbi:MAG: DUF4358 domain-containing protein [Lachnospiraceae bacterium]
MRKKILACLGLTLTMALVGCGSRAEEKTIDAEALAIELAEKVTYTDELNKIDSGVAGELYQINTAENAYVYVSSGATAEEVAVFEFADEEDAGEAVEAANTRIQEQKESFEMYAPEEVSRLDKAIVKQSGRYLMVCITEDTDTAENIIEDYFQ